MIRFVCFVVGGHWFHCDYLMFFYLLSITALGRLIRVVDMHAAFIPTVDKTSQTEGAAAAVHPTAMLRIDTIAQKADGAKVLTGE